MTIEPGTRHLGLDLGATNLKWAVVEHAGDTWSTLAHGQVPTRLVADPDAVPASVTSQLAEMAATVIAEWGPVASVGVGVPGLYDPATGCIRFLPNVPGPWAGHPVGDAVAAAAGAPVFLINDARAFGLAELRLGAGRGASSMVGLTLGTGVGGVIADRRPRPPGPRRHGRRARPPDDRPGRAVVRLRQPRLRRGVRAGRPDRRGLRDGHRRGGGPRARRPATRGRWRASPRSGATWGSGSATPSSWSHPDRIVIGGGVAAAGELLFAPIRAEIARRVTITAVDDVALVAAELGTLAGAIGAAVHGAERAAETAARGGAAAAPRVPGGGRAETRP